MSRLPDLIAAMRREHDSEPEPDYETQRAPEVRTPTEVLELLAILSVLLLVCSMIAYFRR